MATTEELKRTYKQHYGPLAWSARYILDWGTCGNNATPIRLYTTIIRWFHKPHIRWQQWNSARTLLVFKHRQLTAQHQHNLEDFLDSKVEVPMDLDRRAVGLFFASLTDGDIIDGGPTPDWIPIEARLYRPGFAYVWGKWHVYFPDMAPPWPFWLFPRKEVFITP